MKLQIKIKYCIIFLEEAVPGSISVESGTGGQAAIKSHHNVGGLPEEMGFSLIEPLKSLYKNEVRDVGLALGLSDEIVWRQPFPGPGLAIRSIGDITEAKLKIVRDADYILRDEIAKTGLEREIWQYFAALLDIRSVDVQDGKRTYAYPIVIRAVNSVDGINADWVKMPYEILEIISERILKEVAGVNRVVLDITGKPPGTIEWE